MLRGSFKKNYIGMNKEFRYRGEEATRIETLSDAGFALAIGLLLISTSPPTNFKQLLVFTRDLIPFALCITLIMLVWFEHFIFFIRYGFRNARIVFLNTLLLFIILFYVYPLKFLAKLLVNIYASLFSNLFGIENQMSEVFKDVISLDGMPHLMIIYGLGASSIFIVLMLMYRYALKRADELELNEIEKFDTRSSVRANFLMASVPLFSVLLAMLIPNSMAAGTISGFAYFLYFPVMLIFGKRVDRKRKILLERLTESPVEQPT
jgi:uncharacterized membrane protein